MKALVVEDAAEVIETISLLLKIRWPDCAIISTGSGNDAPGLVEKESPDIVILDLALPDRDGLDVLREVRSFSDVAVVLVTANDSETSRVKGLELGADDYISKPFSHTELLARIKAVLRRLSMPELKNDEGVLRLANLIVDFAARRIVHADGREVPLTPTEWSLLSYLYRNKGRAIPYEMLSEKVWGSQYVSRAAIKALIHRLRHKLSDDGNSSEIIRTYRGIGYGLATSFTHS